MAGLRGTAGHHGNGMVEILSIGRWWHHVMITNDSRNTRIDTRHDSNIQKGGREITISVLRIKASWKSPADTIYRGMVYFISHASGNGITSSLFRILVPDR